MAIENCLDARSVGSDMRPIQQAFSRLEENLHSINAVIDALSSRLSAVSYSTPQKVAESNELKRSGSALYENLERLSFIAESTANRIRIIIDELEI